MASATNSSTTAGAGAGASAGAGAGTGGDLPSAKVLLNAAKIAIEKDRPILLDYYLDSKTGVAFIGQHMKTGDKMLIKSSEEYTSNITKIFSVDGCYIILTENSLYIVSSDIKARKVSGSG
jgi:hypothetical protein